jgi:hypothetical protein
MSHTPGPWLATKNYCWSGKKLNIETEKWKSICFVSTLNEDDANLIAAAPILLEALIKMVELSEHIIVEPKLKRSYKNKLDFASAAIRAATGGAK